MLWHWYSYKSFLRQAKENNDWKIVKSGDSKLLEKLKVIFLTFTLFDAYINLEFDTIWFIQRCSSDIQISDGVFMRF